MNRTTLSLLAVTAAVAVVSGAAALTGPPADGGTGGSTGGATTRMPVESTTVLCPSPSTTDAADTTYTSFTPAQTKTGKKGQAELVAAKGMGETADPGGMPSEPLTKQGKPVTSQTDQDDAPALIGTANGELAPGYTVQQTTDSVAGPGGSILGATCSAPDTDFYFPGASTAEERQDFVHLTNPDTTAAVLDLELYGKDGAVETTGGENITVPAHSTQRVLLSTLTTHTDTNLTLHVAVRSGRVGALVEAVDSTRGADWLAASADPSPTVVLPGVPKDTTGARLVVFVPGSDDADLRVRVATPTGSISPAGVETLHVKSGMTTAVDLAGITQGEAAAVVLTPTDSSRATPVVAALRIVRGNGNKQDLAFLPATAPVTTRATAADNRTEVPTSGGSTLYITAPTQDARVKVISSMPSEGGTAATKTVEVKAGTTVALAPPKPSGKGAFAVTVEPLSGAGQVYAARMLALPENGVQKFTVQPMPDDRGTVAVPDARADLAILNGGE